MHTSPQLRYRLFQIYLRIFKIQDPSQAHQSLARVFTNKTTCQQNYEPLRVLPAGGYL